MKNVLSAKQYSKYAAVLNVTLNNEGIKLEDNSAAKADCMKK